MISSIRQNWCSVECMVETVPALYSTSPLVPVVVKLAIIDSIPVLLGSLIAKVYYVLQTYYCINILVYTANRCDRDRDRSQYVQ